MPPRSTRVPTGALESMPGFGDLLIAVPIAAGIVISMALGSTPLTGLTSFTALATALVAPRIGLAILAFMAPLMPPSVVPAPGFGAALVGAILLGCVYRLPIERPHLRVTTPVALLIAFVVYVTMEQSPATLAGYATEADHAIGYLYLQLLAGFGTIVAAIWLLRDRSPFPILAMAVAGAVTAALIAVIPYAVPATAASFALVAGHTDDPVRAVGTFSNPNFMGGSTAMSLAAAAALMVGARSRRVRGVLLAGCVILGAAVLITLSRGAMITALVGLAAVGLTQGRKTAVIVLLLSLVGVFVVYPAFVDWRLTNILGSASAAAFQITAESDAGRLTGALAGFTLFLTSPLFGVGFGQYLAAAVQLPGVANAAHNWYTYVLGEQGIVGAVLFIAVMASLIPGLRALPRRPRTVGVSMLAAFVAACLFLEVPASFQTFAIPAIVLVASLVARWPDGRPEPATSPAPAMPELAAVGA